MPKTIGAVIFPGFELLDLFGPLEMFGMLEDAPDIRMVAETMDPVVSRQGPASVVDATFAEGATFDLLLVPGGPGTRPGIENEALIEWLGQASDASALVRPSALAVRCWPGRGGWTALQRPATRPPSNG